MLSEKLQRIIEGLSPDEPEKDLRTLIACGIIIDEEYTQLLNHMHMKKREDIRKRHKFKISVIAENRKSGQITRYRTFLPDEDGRKGKAIIKTSEKELLDALIIFYRERDKECLPTFGDVYARWVAYHHKKNKSSNNTIDKYRTDYARFIKDTSMESLLITDITDVLLDEYFIDVITSYTCRSGEAGLEYKPFGKLYGYFEGVFQYAYRHRLIDDNPMWRLSKKEYRATCKEVEEKTAETELIPDNEFNLLLDQIYADMKKHPDNFTFYAVEFAAKTGMRVGEVGTLRWSDINYQDGFIEVSRSDKYNKVRDENGKIIERYWTVEKTKTKKRRRFPIDDYIITSLNRIRKAQMLYNCASEWVFPHPVYGWTRSNLISSCIKNKCIQLGFSRTYGIHALRKTLNTDMRMDGASAKTCSSMIGNTPEVNDQYYSYDNSDLDMKKSYVESAHKKRAYK